MPPAIMSLLISGGVALAAALAIALGVPAIVRRLGRRWPPVTALVRAAQIPFRILVLIIAVNAVVAANRPRGEGAEMWDALAHLLRITGIINGAWLFAVIVLFVIDAAVRRADHDLDPRNAKRIRTQVQITRRVVVALIVVIAVASVLLTFDGVRAVGASLLASAGLASVVAALAAQSTLGNLFAGLQLAFSDAIRIDDVVIVEEHYGTIEEITLSYVVVKIWDERRVVLPCTYFTTTPFENWTRKDTELMGTVEFDLDWRVDMEGLRAEFDRVLADTDLYNGRSHAMVITEATGGMVKARASLTADDDGALWNLRCLVRERLVTWVREHNPQALPRQRTQLVDTALPTVGPAVSASEIDTGKPDQDATGPTATPASDVGNGDGGGDDGRGGGGAPSTSV